MVVSSVFLVSFLIRYRKCLAKKQNAGRKVTERCELVVNMGSNVLIGLLLFLRVDGAGYQYVIGKLRRPCFITDDDVLIQLHSNMVVKKSQD